MAIRVRATGEVDARGDATFEVTTDLPVAGQEAVSRSRLVALEAREEAIRAVVAAMKALADAQGPGVIRRALAELATMTTREAAPEALARAEAAKKVYTDAILAIDALP